MKKVFSLLLVLNLVGCGTFLQPTMQFPTPPALLMTKAEPLKVIQTDPNTAVKLSSFISTVTENYTTYYQVAEQLNSLQTWVINLEKVCNGNNTN